MSNNLQADQFTLLTVRTPEPIRTVEGGLAHRIIVAFAPKSDVTFNQDTVEVCASEVKEVFLVFHVGSDLSDFANGLRLLADRLDQKPNQRRPQPNSHLDTNPS